MLHSAAFCISIPHSVAVVWCDYWARLLIGLKFFSDVLIVFFKPPLQFQIKFRIPQGKIRHSWNDEALVSEGRPLNTSSSLSSVNLNADINLR